MEDITSESLLGEILAIKKQLYFLDEARKTTFLVSGGINGRERAVLNENVDFFSKYLDHSARVIEIDIGALRTRRSIFEPVLHCGEDLFDLLLVAGEYNINYQKNHLAGWMWHSWLRSTIAKDVYRTRQEQSRLRFGDWITGMVKKKLNRSYVFGTGPSLEKASDRKWDDGYKIVCNTIVRDKRLWHWIEPDVIVAGDPMYHFGVTRFAQAFRFDLKARLTESKQAVFVYPSEYDSMVRVEMAGFEDRLLPIEVGDHQFLGVDLKSDFRLPNLGNVLSLILLPVALNLSKNVYLWGFDGRAPKDKYFWKNSSKHTYDEYFDDLVKTYPAFFEHNVPKSDPTKYLRREQGDLLDQLMSQMEDNGFRFVMMHPSFTPTLAKRYKK